MEKKNVYVRAREVVRELRAPSCRGFGSTTRSLRTNSRELRKVWCSTSQRDAGAAAEMHGCGSRRRVGPPRKSGRP